MLVKMQQKTTHSSQYVTLSLVLINVLKRYFDGGNKLSEAL